jgi:hypothetical protein
MFVLLLTFTATLSAYGQGVKRPRTPEDYQARTLREYKDLLPPGFAADEQLKNNYQTLAIILHGDLLPSRVKATFQGTTRPLNERRNSLITRWARERAGAPEFYASYDAEALFTADGEDYWLAVRKESLPQIEQELKKGDIVELFLIKMGNIRIDNKMEPVILVEKYIKQ